MSCETMIRVLPIVCCTGKHAQNAALDDDVKRVVGSSAKMICGCRKVARATRTLAHAAAELVRVGLEHLDGRIELWR